MSHLSTSEMSPSAAMFVGTATAGHDMGALAPLDASPDARAQATRELRAKLRRDARRSSFAEIFWLCVTVTGVASAVVGVVFR